MIIVTSSQSLSKRQLWPVACQLAPRVTEGPPTRVNAHRSLRGTANIYSSTLSHVQYINHMGVTQCNEISSPRNSCAVRNPTSTKVRGVVITFHCSAPNFVEINEAIIGHTTHSQNMQRNPDVVMKTEGEYIFFATKQPWPRRWREGATPVRSASIFGSRNRK